MELTIKTQDRYSRLQLLLRTFFGWLYIAIPHGIILFFLGIWSAILTFVAFWIVLFTGKYPKTMFDYQVGFNRWNLRVNTAMMNLSDGYPGFGLDVQDENLNFNLEYPEKISRVLLLLRLFLGWLYVMIPHGFLLFFRTIATMVIVFISWFAVLFTGKYPAVFHEYVTGLMRWNTRVNLYIAFLTDQYPPFNGKA
ncbi:MAG TPA: DUF4389 domain-containing protein [Bacteroidales bacterium]|nr:DUF4389 domain-containing protein [Bacteroidales bacterium]